MTFGFQTGLLWRGRVPVRACRLLPGGLSFCFCIPRGSAHSRDWSSNQGGLHPMGRRDLPWRSFRVPAPPHPHEIALGFCFQTGQIGAPCSTPQPGCRHCGVSKTSCCAPDARCLACADRPVVVGGERLGEKVSPLPGLRWLSHKRDRQRRDHPSLPAFPWRAGRCRPFAAPLQRPNLGSRIICWHGLFRGALAR